MNRPNQYRELAPNVREYLPQKRTIAYRYEGQHYFSHVAFPHMLFYNATNNSGQGPMLMVGFVEKPVSSWEDTGYLSPMGNIYPGGWVCLERSHNFDTVVRKFWTTEFSSDGDAGQRIRSHLGHRLIGLHQLWETLSTEQLLTLLKGLPDHKLDCKFKLTLRNFINGEEVRKYCGLDFVSVPPLNLDAPYYGLKNESQV